MPEIKIKDYKAGSTVVIQNAPNPGLFYIVRKGVLAIDTEHRLNDKVLSRFEAGDSFGLVSALTGHHFLVTIYAATEAQVAEIPIAMIGSYLKAQSDLAVKMLRLYSRELRTIQLHLSKLDNPEDRNFTPDVLYNLSHKYIEWQKPHYAARALHAYIAWAEKNEGVYLDMAKTLWQEVEKDHRPVQFLAKATPVPADTMIFSEGEMGREIFVVISGSVKLMRIVRGEEFIIDVLGAGELFGEMAFIENAPRMGSAVTTQDSQIIRILPEQLVSNVGEGVLQKIFENMARRIWFSHQRLIIFKITDPLVRMYAFLYNLVRNQNMRMRDKSGQDRSYKFDITLTELKTMCGIVRLKDTTESSFITNTNFIVEPGSITIKSRKKLEDQIAYYRAKSGQIIAETK
ncbi:MAG: cyclic nucleotide-binding domain-containing protein [Turneriella sp.]|nr:cyclic nucleotide-binding domain-containing protein [Turneriella sp.]